MLQDVVRGQATEVDYLNGYVARHGTARGVPCPWNEALAALVRAREACPLDLLTNERL